MAYQALQRRLAGQPDGSDNLSATLAADRAFPAAVVEWVGGGITRIMRFILSLLASAMWFGWSTTAAETNRPLTEFHEANFGVSFSHSKDVTTDYDPHGRANQVAMSRKETPIGGLKILRPFPSTNDTEFVESATNYYKETSGASSVEHRFYDCDRHLQIQGTPLR